MFSQRHYQAIADVIKVGKFEPTLHAELVIGLIEMFERDNPKFDRVRFLDACGLGIAKPAIVDAFIAADKLEIIVVK